MVGWQHAPQAPAVPVVLSAGPEGAQHFANVGTWLLQIAQLLILKVLAALRVPTHTPSKC